MSAKIYRGAVRTCISTVWLLVSFVQLFVILQESVQREKLWSAFHNVSVGELPKLWSELFSSGHIIPKLSPLVYQNVNQRLYEDLLKSHVCSQSTSTCSSPTEVPPLTANENIIRYAAGYVAF